MKNEARFPYWIGSLCVACFALWAHAGLISHWELDEEPGTGGFESIADSGPSGAHPGTPVYQEAAPIVFEEAGATDTTGTSATFSGVGIDVPYDSALNPPSFTFCAWARVDALGGHQSVVTSRHDNFPDLAGYILYCTPDGTWSFWTGRSGAWDGLNGPPVLVGAWAHLAIVFDADSGTKTLYVNGTAITTDTQLYVPNQVRDLHLGAGGDAGTQYQFNGGIDDAALWDVPLAEEDIVSVMEEGAGAVPLNMVAHWKLDESADATAVEDASGNGHTGMLPPPPFSPGAPGAAEWSGTAICFSNASIDVIYAPELNPPSFTVTAWAKPEVTAGFQSLITNRNDINLGEETQGFVLYNDNNGNWAFWTGIGPTLGAFPWAVLEGPPVQLGQWQHVAISYDAGTNVKRLFVNGEEVASSIDQPCVPNTLRDLHIGGGGDMGDQYRFAGCIDDVSLWDEALPQEKIQDIMENGVSEMPPPQTFVRGDVNDDGNRNIADAVSILFYLFASGDEPGCPDTADTNDDAAINIADAIRLLEHLFGSGGDLPAPFPECGDDPSADSLGDCLYTHCP